MRVVELLGAQDLCPPHRFVDCVLGEHDEGFCSNVHADVPGLRTMKNDDD
jgi:hypothetical protein